VDKLVRKRERDREIEEEEKKQNKGKIEDDSREMNVP